MLPTETYSASKTGQNTYGSQCSCKLKDIWDYAVQEYGLLVLQTFEQAEKRRKFSE